MLGIPGGNPPPALEMEKGIFHEMTQFIEIRVVGTLDFPVFAGWNHHRHPLRLGLGHHGIAIVPTIR